MAKALVGSFNKIKVLVAWGHLFVDSSTAHSDSVPCHVLSWPGRCSYSYSSAAPSWTMVQKLYSSGPQLVVTVCVWRTEYPCPVQLHAVHWLHPVHYFISWAVPQIQELARNPYHCPHSISSPFVHPPTYMPPLIGFLNLNVDTVIITKYSEKAPPLLN